MPDLTFVMPHWLYWSGLALFPVFAMFMVRRARRTQRESAVSLALAYLFWLTGGFIGIHRFYLRNWLGVLYPPLFCGILYANVQFRIARDALSRVRSDLKSADFQVEHFTKQLKDGIDAAQAKLEAARNSLRTARAVLDDSAGAVSNWDSAAMGLAIAIALLLLYDAFVLPGLTRACAANEPYRPDPGSPVLRSGGDAAPGQGRVPAGAFGAPIRRIIETVSGWIGHYVAYWSVIAVFVYYYEVMARYVFNSPTNWAHESMFLMFGMQYLLCGSFAYREDAHVRVDVVYVMLSDRAKAIMNVITSVLFFIFAATLLWTGWIFARDAIGVWEVSFTEWAIQYWPVKMTISMGAALILLQGLARLLKDVSFLMHREA